MRMLTKVLLLVVSVMIFSSGPVLTDTPKGIPVDKIFRVDTTLIAFEGTVYKIYNSDAYYLTFQKVDDTHNRVIVELRDGVRSIFGFCIQWESFPTVCLDIDPDGENSYLLGTETGYAEK